MLSIPNFRFSEGYFLPNQKYAVGSALVGFIGLCIVKRPIKIALLLISS